jgi:uncharacterized membrane protein
MKMLTSTRRAAAETNVVLVSLNLKIGALIIFLSIIFTSILITVPILGLLVSLHQRNQAKFYERVA